MTLDEARNHIGHAVTYTPPGYREPAADEEEGQITSVSDVFVFVRYGRDYHSKATAPEYLRLTHARVRRTA